MKKQLIDMMIEAGVKWPKGAEYAAQDAEQRQILLWQVQTTSVPKQEGDSMKFKTVAEYYSYMAQGNCFAPKFEDLHDSAKAYWVADFEKYNNKAGVDSE